MSLKSSALRSYLTENIHTSDSWVHSAVIIKGSTNAGVQVTFSVPGLSYNGNEVFKSYNVRCTS